LESNNKSLGENFSLVQWCDEWLTTSGVNILEPIVEYDDQNKLKSLKIK